VRTAPRVWQSSVICNRIAIILLLVGLAGLATTAKDGKYYHGTNPAHQSSLSTKMNVTQSPITLGSTPLEKVARIIATKPRLVWRTRREPEQLVAESLGLRLSVRHRSPPAFFSL